MILTGLLLVCLIILAGIAWAIHEAPVIDERHCTRKHLLVAGECEGPCDRVPPCSMEVKL